MAGSLRSGFKAKRKGGRHGAHTHHHASGNGLVRYYFGAYQAVLRERRDRRRKSEMFATIREALDSIGRRLFHEVSS